MHARKAWCRTTTAVAVGFLLAAHVPLPGCAQSASTPPPGTGAEQQPADAPARVGRLARITGTVSFHPDGADRWDPAIPNYPVTNGYAFWTEPQARAEIGIGASHIVMSASTELDINVIDELSANFTQPQGEIYLRLRGLMAGESYTIQTPRGTVLLRANGRYGVFAGDTENPTRVTVLEGAAQVSGPNVSLELAAGQMGIIEGIDDFAAHTGPAEQTAFLTAQAEPVAPPPVSRPAPVPAPGSRAAPSARPPAHAQSGHAQSGQRMQRAQRMPAAPVEAPPPVAAMPGGEELNAYGTWEQADGYGRVWFPRAAAGWQPYRDGRWVWVKPWGWTWVDDAPWGFAPSHYGRWILIGRRWAWWPGAATSGRAAGVPVYAPALVAFRNGARPGQSVGWFPLGWREAYRPWYGHSPAYLRDINRFDSGDGTGNRAGDGGPAGRYANQRTMLTVPATAMTNSARIGGVARPAAQNAAQRLPPGGRGEPPAPSTATLGMSTDQARRLNLILPQSDPRPNDPGQNDPGQNDPGAQPRPSAPGPILFKPTPGMFGAARAAMRPRDTDQTNGPANGQMSGQVNGRPVYTPESFAPNPRVPLRTPSR